MAWWEDVPQCPVWGCCVCVCFYLTSDGAGVREPGPGGSLLDSRSGLASE
jgi:hypothetical protein